MLRSGKRRIGQPFGNESESASSHPKEKSREEEQMNKFTQRLQASLENIQPDLKKKYGIERLKALGATNFEGTKDPANAEAWMNQIEKYFEVMRCPKNRKVSLATFLLQKQAEDWWKLLKNRRGNQEEICWEEFRKAFFERFYPRSFRDRKQDEFLQLMQGNMTIVEYELKYTKLSKYALNIVVDEKERCRRFETGLRQEIRTPVTATAEWGEFSRLIEVVMRVERSLMTEEVRPERDSSMSRWRREKPRNFTPRVESRSGWKRREVTNTKANPERESQIKESMVSVNQRLRCPVCNKYHWGRCWKQTQERSHTYFKCGRPGHFKRECPKLMDTGNVQPPNNPGGR
ncbi:uncharacterized protein LOC120084630 [Benincasa hispida]|uniref:uncharacterized protein LOC120084630 n=1 Tax=Benincasa hispida TaxID=102211 RepID=UPI0018FF1597|nr:uncharacterized protein LOC120084630 [Benincasa hispida]